MSASVSCPGAVSPPVAGAQYVANAPTFPARTRDISSHALGSSSMTRTVPAALPWTTGIRLLKSAEAGRRFDAERRWTLEKNLTALFDELKRKFPVRILDPELKNVQLPALPEPSSL